MDENLYVAAKAGDVTSLDRLQQEKPDILMGLTPYHRETVCHVALRHENEEFAWEAYSRNPILCTFKSKKGDYLLHWVLKARKKNFFKKCIESEWSVSCSDPSSFLVNDEGKSLMFLAVEMGILAAVKSLLGSSFGTNCCGPNNSTALHAAVFQPLNRNAILWSILQNFWELVNSIDGDGNTPLHHVVSSNNEHLLEILQDRDTSYISNEAGLTPIHLSASLGNLQIFERLLQLNPESIWLTTNKSKNMLHLSVEARKVNIVQAIMRRPELRELLHEKDEDGNTPLHIAATIGDEEMQKVLETRDHLVLYLIKNREGLTVREVEEKRRKNRKEEARQNRVIERETRRKIRLANLNVLLVVDTLLLTMAYSAVLNVPGGFKDNGTASLIPTIDPCTATPIDSHGCHRQRSFEGFTRLNTILFTTAIWSLFSAILSVFFETSGLYEAAFVFPCLSFSFLILGYGSGLSAVISLPPDPIIKLSETVLPLYCFLFSGTIVMMLLKKRRLSRAPYWIILILSFSFLVAIYLILGVHMVSIIYK